MRANRQYQPGKTPLHMLIQCTKALLDKVKTSPSELKPPEGYEELPCALMAWHATNIVNINGRKAVVWRRILVPSILSFLHLHNVIQAVFDWRGYHLHMFEAGRQGPKVKQIVMDEGLETLLWFDANSCDILKERITALKDIFPDNGILRR